MGTKLLHFRRNAKENAADFHPDPKLRRNSLTANTLRKKAKPKGAKGKNSVIYFAVNAKKRNFANTLIPRETRIKCHILLYKQA